MTVYFYVCGFTFREKYAMIKKRSSYQKNREDLT